jgi:hypothetical protein
MGMLFALAEVALISGAGLFVHYWTGKAPSTEAKPKEKSATK